LLQRVNLVHNRGEIAPETNPAIDTENCNVAATDTRVP
jgi:hypothetical protein